MRRSNQTSPGGVLVGGGFYVRMLVTGIALMVGGGAAFVGSVFLLFPITDMPVPGRRDYDSARTGECAGYTDLSNGTYSVRGHHHAGGGGHDGGGGN